MDPHAQYRAQATSTASPAQLVLMLYDGCLAEIDRAEVAMTGRIDAPAAHEALVRAQRIVQELTVTLDHERGGDVAGNLSRLYRYADEQLLQANLAKDAGPLGIVRSIISGLRDSWAIACTGAVAVA